MCEKVQDANKIEKKSSVLHADAFDYYGRAREKCLKKISKKIINVERKSRDASYFTLITSHSRVLKCDERWYKCAEDTPQ